MKLMIALSLSAVSLFWACNKNGDGDNAASGQQKDKPENTYEIPDSAMAVLEKIIREEKAGTGKERKPNEEWIGDGAWPGTVQVIGNRMVITGARIGELCPNKRTAGDPEFGGGPWISCRATIISLRNSLWAYVEFKAKETGADFSTVKLAPEYGWVKVRDLDCNRITQINSSTTAWVDFRGQSAGPEFGPWFCNDGAIESRWPTGGTLVKRFNIIGDTGGYDISYDFNCSCDTKIHSIELNPIVVTFE